MAKASKPKEQPEPQRNLSLEEVDRLCREQAIPGLENLDEITAFVQGKLTEEVLVVLCNAIIPGLDAWEDMKAQWGLM